MHMLSDSEIQQLLRLVDVPALDSFGHLPALHRRQHPVCVPDGGAVRLAFELVRVDEQRPVARFVRDILLHLVQDSVRTVHSAIVVERGDDLPVGDLPDW